ncbi:MAG: SAM-dependent methyltransferase [Mycobacterium sp.]|nr:SAM-dependent methyltransferase [Mycobacterium sp.]
MAAPDQTAAGHEIDRHSNPESKVRFYLDLFGCRSDIYAVRWENRRDGRAGWAPAINCATRKAGGAINVYETSGIRTVARTREQVEGLFDGLDLLDPGIELVRWRPRRSMSRTVTTR